MILAPVNPEPHEVLVPVHWSHRQNTARRLLAAAELIGFDAQVVRTGRGGYIVPAEVALEASQPGSITGGTEAASLLHQDAKPRSLTEAPSDGARYSDSSSGVEESPADRPLTQREIVTQAFTEHPELLTLPVREVARQLGVQPSTVSKTRKVVTGG